MGVSEERGPLTGLKILEAKLNHKKNKSKCTLSLNFQSWAELAQRLITQRWQDLINPHRVGNMLEHVGAAALLYISQLRGGNVTTLMSPPAGCFGVWRKTGKKNTFLPLTREIKCRKTCKVIRVIKWLLKHIRSGSVHSFISDSRCVRASGQSASDQTFRLAWKQSQSELKHIQRDKRCSHVQIIKKKTRVTCAYLHSNKLCPIL